MHVVVGGAHNGKRAYVRELIGTDEDYLFADRPEMIDALPDCEKVVVANIEEWLLQTKLSEAEAISHILKITEGREVIFILTDIGRGIVPMDAEQRRVRDACGRLYQRLFREANVVTRVWYGLPQTLKKRGE
ncbi:MULTISPECIES: bifunctional adenosylcobinamide kinase/adenosylcobinamide-phosphate guanylyltransferase [Sporosarcina]|uniref:Bifunctional adenosylcobinamide kinase/adenosylcobinamide-phosphate guanylyltransferase n=1 Tax=Sporosarcina contaminans TaxID=633403 RepID=A0ABW3TY62_9BACL